MSSHSVVRLLAVLALATLLVNFSAAVLARPSEDMVVHSPDHHHGALCVTIDACSEGPSCVTQCGGVEGDSLTLSSTAVTIQRATMARPPTELATVAVPKPPPKLVLLG